MGRLARPPHTAALVASLLTVLFGACRAQCPNMCNGHGECGTESVCECEDAWSYFPDCSGQFCPTGPAISSKAYSSDVAHSAAECSNRGICDRDYGVCECFEGFIGDACQRVGCLNDCSGAGHCVTTNRAGLDFGFDTSAGYIPGGDGLGPQYGNWDGEVFVMCVCDWGFTGPDCSMRMCPKGDDPLTIGQNYRTVNITTSSNTTLDPINAHTRLNGTFALTFEGHTFTFNADANQFSEQECEAQWEGLDNVYDVRCTRSEIGVDNSATYMIEFVDWPSWPIQNNIFNHFGNPPLGAFTCDVSNAHSFTNNTNQKVGNPTCTVKDIKTTDVIEYDYCSARGMCDFGSGICTCYFGFTGVNCEETLSNLVTDVDGDILLIHSQVRVLFPRKFDLPWVMSGDKRGGTW